MLDASVERERLPDLALSERGRDREKAHVRLQNTPVLGYGVLRGRLLICCRYLLVTQDCQAAWILQAIGSRFSIGCLCPTNKAKPGSLSHSSNESLKEGP